MYKKLIIHVDSMLIIVYTTCILVGTLYNVTAISIMPKLTIQFKLDESLHYCNIAENSWVGTGVKITILKYHIF